MLQVGYTIHNSSNLSIKPSADSMDTHEMNSHANVSVSSSLYRPTVINTLSSELSPRPLVPSPESDRPERMRDWLMRMIESGRFAGLKWLDKEEMIFRVPWIHAKKRDYIQERDAALFREWAIHSGKYGDGSDVTTWKINFRCALNGLKDIIERRELEESDCRVYQMLPTSGAGRRRKRRRPYYSELVPVTTFQQAGERNGRPRIDSVPISPTTPATPTVPTTILTPTSGTPIQVLPIIAGTQPIIAGTHPIHLPLALSPSIPSSSGSPLTTPLTPVFKTVFPTPANQLLAPHAHYFSPPSLNPSHPPLTSIRHPSTNGKDVGMEGSHPTTPHTPHTPHTPLSPKGVCSPNIITIPPHVHFDKSSVLVAPRPSVPPHLSSSSSSSSSSPPPPPPTNNVTSSTAAASTAIPLEKIASLTRHHNLRNGPVYCPPVEFSNSPSAISVRIMYGSITVHMETFHCTKGCRIFYGPLHCRDVLEPEDEEKLFGPLDAHQISLSPRHPATLAQEIFKVVKRGLVIEVENASIYATPLCRALIYYGSSPLKHSGSLKKEERTKVFEYAEFSHQLSQSSSEGGGRTPKPYVIFSIGQLWGTNRPIITNLVTVTVTYCRALSDLCYKNLPITDELLFEAQEDKDIQIASPTSKDLEAEEFLNPRH